MKSFIVNVLSFNENKVFKKRLVKFQLVFFIFHLYFDKGKQLTSHTLK